MPTPRLGLLYDSTFFCTECGYKAIGPTANIHGGNLLLLDYFFARVIRLGIKGFWLWLGIQIFLRLFFIKEFLVGKIDGLQVARNFKVVLIIPGIFRGGWLDHIDQFDEFTSGIRFIPLIIEYTNGLLDSSRGSDWSADFELRVLTQLVQRLETGGQWDWFTRVGRGMLERIRAGPICRTNPFTGTCDTANCQQPHAEYQRWPERTEDWSH